MLYKTSNMPESQWKLTIVERNLSLCNWVKLIPEAQEQMLWEADRLMEDLPLPDRHRLLTALETLQKHTEMSFQPKIQLILNRQFSLDIRKALELNIQYTTLRADGQRINSSVLLEAIN